MQQPALLSYSLSQIVFGGAAISGEGGGYGFGPISDSEANRLILSAWERGITTFDVAPIYGFSLAEKRLGAAFKNQRDQVQYISKGGVTWDLNRRVDIDNRPATLQKMLEQSLRDLQTDWIDIYMVHWPDPRTDIRLAIEYLERAREDGKIHTLGLANTNEQELTLAQEISAHIKVVQNECNLFSSPTPELRTFLTQNKIHFMGWGTFDKGIITQRANPHRQYAPSDARSWAPWWKRSLKKEKMQAIQRVARQFNFQEEELVKLALSYNLIFAQADSTICGCRSLVQLESILEQHAKLYSFQEMESMMATITPLLSLTTENDE